MSFTQALAGGAMLGGASALLMLTHGRVAGVSTIAANAVTPADRERGWRLAFVAGLLLAGLVSAIVAPAAVGTVPRSYVVVAIAGLLVGIGTRIGSGCTSGHGVCGLSRGSPRSLFAVATFMFVAAVTATIAGRLA